MRMNSRFRVSPCLGLGLAKRFGVSGFAVRFGISGFAVRFGISGLALKLGLGL